MIDGPVLEAGLEHAHHHAEHQGDAQGDQADAHRHAETAADDVHHRLVHLDAPGSAQVKTGQPRQEIAQLHQGRVQQSFRLQAGVLLVLGQLHQLVFAEIVVRRHHPHQQKNRRNDQDDRHEGLHQPFDQVFGHAGLHLT